MKNNLEEKLITLADGILDEAGEQPFGLRLDALKAVSALHLGLAKISSKLTDEDDPTAPSLLAMRDRISGASQGTA